MGIIKDWRENNQYYRTSYKIRRLFSIKEWLELHKWRKQRADRGWSDKDTWSMDEHILRVSSEMIRKLAEEKHGVWDVDWESYFKNNEFVTYGYGSFDEVADDIDEYLKYQTALWTDYIDFELPSGHVDDDGFYVSNATERQEFKMKKAMEKHNRESIRLHEKSAKAMRFIAANHGSLWW